jgi:hypothetical protein
MCGSGHASHLTNAPEKPMVTDDPKTNIDGIFIVQDSVIYLLKYA